MCRHADAEIEVLLAESVPPVDCSRIGVFRAPMAKHAKEAGWPVPGKCRCVKGGRQKDAGS